jgi:hypothetical protein
MDNQYPRNDPNKYHFRNINDRKKSKRKQTKTNRKVYSDYMETYGRGISDCRLESMGPSQFFSKQSKILIYSQIFCKVKN